MSVKTICISWYYVQNITAQSRLLIKIRDSPMQHQQFQAADSLIRELGNYLAGTNGGGYRIVNLDEIKRTDKVDDALLIVSDDVVTIRRACNKKGA